MKRPCYVVYTITRNLMNNKIVEFSFLNAFETEQQAKASLQYEVDLAAAEGDEGSLPERERTHWISESTILYAKGWSDIEETIATYACECDFYDASEPPIKYKG